MDSDLEYFIKLKSKTRLYDNCCHNSKDTAVSVADGYVLMCADYAWQKFNIIKGGRDGLKYEGFFIQYENGKSN